MNNITLYDLIFLFIFTVAVTIFLYVKRKNLKREMKIMFLYRTKIGIKFIEYIGGKYKRTLGVLQYIIIGLGYILMVGIVYIIGKSVYLYVSNPFLITQITKAPPIAPLIPYFPQLFGMQSFFPEFSFTYFIVSISIVAIVHEFSHGIFMKYNKIKIKSTGIVFLGPILGAFVEQDDKDMNRAPKKAQLAILGAGVFANIVTGIIFFFIWWGLFYAAFNPIGVNFNTYAQGIVSIGTISSIGGIPIQNLTNNQTISLMDRSNLSNDIILEFNNNTLVFTKIIADNQTYYITKDILKSELETQGDMLILYEDLPAINTGLRGRITSIDDKKVSSISLLKSVLKNYEPGQKINIKTVYNDEVLSFDMVLANDQFDEDRAIIGISSSIERNMNIAENFAFFKEPSTEYEVRNSFMVFLYYLVFWIFLINILVGLFNMLPLSILDGGRFFFITIWGITKNEKFAENAFKWSGRIILIAFLLMMIAYFVGIFGMIRV